MKTITTTVAAKARRLMEEHQGNIALVKIDAVARPLPKRVLEAMVVPPRRKYERRVKFARRVAATKGITERFVIRTRIVLKEGAVALSRPKVGGPSLRIAQDDKQRGGAGATV